MKRWEHSRSGWLRCAELRTWRKGFQLCRGCSLTAHPPGLRGHAQHAAPHLCRCDDRGQSGGQAGAVEVVGGCQQGARAVL